MDEWTRSSTRCERKAPFEIGRGAKCHLPSQRGWQQGPRFKQRAGHYQVGCHAHTFAGSNLHSSVIPSGGWLRLLPAQPPCIRRRSSFTRGTGCDVHRGVRRIRVQWLFNPSHSLAARSVSAGTLEILMRN